MNKALIITVYNEEKTILGLIDSIMKQTEMPNEVVIVDGGSRDGTVSSIKYHVSSIKIPRFKVYIKKGNRSVGRNEAIRRSQCEVVAITDAGCLLDKNWFKNITRPFSDKQLDVVAGYYRAKTSSTFEKSLAPYVLVMPDKIAANNFLPATRSMAIRKSVWKKAGGFDEKLSNNEDYEFARRLSKSGANIKFVKSAIVYWIPRVNLKQAFVMFFRFALGDTESGIFRFKVLLLFLRYLIVIALLGLYLISRSYQILNTIYLILFLYLAWSITKNYKYVKDLLAFIYLPLLQLTADGAVITGSIVGMTRLFDTAWSKWVDRINRKLKLWELFNIMAVALFISICLFVVLSVAFPLKFQPPGSNIINWYSVNNYPKQMDYFYFEAGFVFICVSTLILWVLKTWSKAKHN